MLITYTRLFIMIVILFLPAISISTFPASLNQQSIDINNAHLWIPPIFNTID